MPSRVFENMRKIDSEHQFFSHLYTNPTANARNTRMLAAELLYDTWQCVIYTASDEASLRRSLQLRKIGDKTNLTKLTAAIRPAHLAELLRSLLQVGYSDAYLKVLVRTSMWGISIHACAFDSAGARGLTCSAVSGSA